MTLTWHHEQSPRWDAPKERIVGGSPQGAFAESCYEAGDRVSGEWWHVQDGSGNVVGFGWMDATWEGGEVLLAVAPDAQSQGVGAFIVDRLAEAGAKRGYEYIFNMVRRAHPEHERVTRWLESHGFKGSEDGLLRRRTAHAGSGPA